MVSTERSKTAKTYNTRYSLVVTDPTTNPALTGLSMGERTGSRVFQWVWSYVAWNADERNYTGLVGDDEKDSKTQRHITASIRKSSPPQRLICPSHSFISGQRDIKYIVSSYLGKYLRLQQ
ncbi:hypothetical protein LZ30DRAFT_608916 [Colletotrichum cereale]|nr:hypothetical protein LZ30DRAFT_608916 [Colletotrichum cereale]